MYYILFLMLLMFVVVACTPKEIRPISLLYFLSAFYYGVMGLWYWGYEQETRFMSVYWGIDSLNYASFLIVLSALIVVSFLRMLARTLPQNDLSLPVNSSDTLSLYGLGLGFNLIFSVGFVSLLYVCFVSIKAGGFNSGDGYLLIAYQFSDLIIPCLLFAVARYGFNKLIVLTLLGFCIYAIYFGFRYKAVLILVPIFVFMLNPMVGDAKGRRNKYLAIFFIGLLVVIFGITTLVRTKFEGLDLTDLGSKNFEDMLFGVFADANIIFGLVSILDSFVAFDNFIHLQPLTDAVTEFLPRFLFPDKEAGTYVEGVLYGLIAEEAIYSATAYPFFGEYMLMFGYAGYFIMISMLSFFIFGCFAFLHKEALDSRYFSIGVGLLSVFFGYYYFSRGYFPQFVKGFVFVVLPYLFLVARSKSKGGV